MADNGRIDDDAGENVPLVESEGIQSKRKKRRCLPCLLLIVLLAVFVGGIVGLVIAFTGPSDEPSTNEFIYPEAAVAADAAHCSEIGRDFLKKGGTAIDAAIAGLLCVGIYNSHNAGIGGGSFILYYDKKNENATFWDAREWAASAASADMYQNKTRGSKEGGLSIAVPGELRGYWAAHSVHGKIPWKDLFEPTIALAEGGYIVGKALADAIVLQGNSILNDTSLSEVFTDGNGNLLKEGDTAYRRKFAKTLRKIADSNAATFYTGQMAEDIVAEIQARDGIITTDDLANYEATERPTLEFDFDGMTGYSGPPPCSGAVYALILHILKGYEFNPDNFKTTEEKILTYHRIIEAFKFAYAKRSGLGDSSFVDVEGLVINMTSQSFADSLRDRIHDNRTFNYTYYDPYFEQVADSGTTHISIVDQFGNSASITSSVNYYFGSLVRGNMTGIIYNNQMDDFSMPVTGNNGIPPSPTNFIAPGKRPLSSMTPVTLVDEHGDVGFVVGASGGIMITTAISQVTMENMWFHSDLRRSIEKRRVHHSLVPEFAFYERGFPQDIVEGLRKIGHDPVELNPDTEKSVVQAIRRLKDGDLEAYCDSRKDGKPAGF